MSLTQGRVGDGLKATQCQASMSLVTAPDSWKGMGAPPQTEEILDHHDHLISDSGFDDTDLA